LTERGESIAISYFYDIAYGHCGSNGFIVISRLDDARVWTFYDYIEGSRNVISEWLSALPSEVRADLDARLNTLRAMKPPWEFPLVRPLKGKPWKGIREVRFKSNNIQYRVLYVDGPGQYEVTLLLGFDKNTKLDTALAKRMQARKDSIDDDGRVTRHFAP
jgi:hypothetical protein